MATINHVEEILSWQKSIAVLVEIYKISDDEKFSKDFALRNQIRRSAISVPSNIAEGFGRGGNSEFIQFLSIANGSLYELKTQLLIAHKLNYLNLEMYQHLNSEMDEVAKLINGFTIYLQQTEIKGSKFKRGK